MKIQNVNLFPFNISQINCIACIAACTEAVLKYHRNCRSGLVNMPDFPEDLQCQIFIETLKIGKCDLNFKNTKIALERIPSIEGFFRCETNTLEIEKLMKLLELGVEQSYPVILSIPQNHGSHMNVIYGYGKSPRWRIWCFDPDPNLENRNHKVCYYGDKLKDWLQRKKRRDYLQISPKF